VVNAEIPAFTWQENRLAPSSKICLCVLPVVNMNFAQNQLMRALTRFAHHENRHPLVKMAFYGAKVASGSYAFRLNHAAAVVLGPIFGRRIVLHLTLQVCSLCQNNCEHCAHAAMIEANRGYQMSMEDLRTFVEHTKASRYYIENLWITGPGEPTLWKHFNDGIKLLDESGLIGRIIVISNGQSIGRVDSSTWKHIARLGVSTYPSNDHTEILRKLEEARQAGCEIDHRPRAGFRVMPEKGVPGSLPARCMAPGPMIYADRVYYYCGPTGVAAARLKGEAFLDNEAYGAKLGPGYLEGINTRLRYGVGSDTYSTANLDLCRYCWANMMIQLPYVPHSQRRRPAPATGNGE
jgi:hypothetical protein